MVRLMNIHSFNLNIAAIQNFENLVPTEFLFSTATTTTINHKMPMDKGIDHVVVVEF